VGFTGAFSDLSSFFFFATFYVFSADFLDLASPLSYLDFLDFASFGGFYLSPLSLDFYLDLLLDFFSLIFKFNCSKTE